MHERALKTTLIILMVMLTALVAFGVFLVAGTQQGTTAGAIERIIPQPESSTPVIEHLPVEDRA